MNRAAAWLAALAGWAAVVAAFWPGYLGWDSAYLWWQARTGDLDPGAPSAMAHVWQAVRWLLPDPGGMMALPLLAWWAALALVADALGGPPLRRAGLVLAMGFWPPLLAAQPHVWRDVWMVAGFLLAVGFLARDLRTPGRGWRLAALAAITAAACFRFDALHAALPLLGWIAWREAATRPGRVAWRTAVGTVVLAAGVGAVDHFADRAADARSLPPWAATAAWDLAAVSIAEERVLFPAGWADPGLTVADLRRDFSPYGHLPSLREGQLHVDPRDAYRADQVEALRRAWRALPREHAGAYWSHRARASAALFGLAARDQPDHRVLEPVLVRFRDNPGHPTQPGGLARWVQPQLNALVDAAIFAPWLYLVLAAGVLARVAWRRAWQGPRGLAATVALSMLSLALPLVVTASRTDFRQVLWVVAGGVLVAVFAAAARDEDEAAGRPAAA